MDKRYYLLLLACANAVAEPRPLPPVIENSTFKNSSAFSSPSPSNNAMFEILGRLEQLQLEVQQLRGLVEEQEQTLAELKKRQGNIYSDLDQRIQALTPGGQNPGEPSQPVTFSSTQKPPAAKQSHSPKITAPVETAKPPVIPEKQLYKEAYETLRNGHNSRAISLFKTLLREFPAGSYADNSQYWLGEAYKVNQDLDLARQAFDKVVQQYPNSPKVPDALLKLGYIEFEQNNIAKARDFLTQVTVNDPGTTAAHLAAKKLMQIDQR